MSLVHRSGTSSEGQETGLRRKTDRPRPTPHRHGNLTPRVSHTSGAQHIRPEDKCCLLVVDVDDDPGLAD